MGQNFDDILEHGKSKVGAIGRSRGDLLGEYVQSVMDIAHKINDLYSHDGVHHMSMEGIKCEKCSDVSFKVNARNIEDSTDVIAYFKDGWKIKTKGKYLCHNCN